MFRDYTHQQAERLGLTGYVQNLADGRSVEVEAEGVRTLLEDLLNLIRHGPPKAAVENALATWSKYTGTYQDFRIR
jgi:acylphosphatase